MSGVPRHEEVMGELLRLRERATAFCLAVLRDFHGAEDAYQEAALVAVRRMGEYGGGSFAAWFWAILRNVLGTRIRASRRHATVLADEAVLARLERLALEPAAAAPEENVDHLLACLRKLGEEVRHVLELRFLSNLGCAEIARRLGRSVPATYALIKRTRLALRECVELRARAAGGQG